MKAFIQFYNFQDRLRIYRSWIYLDIDIIETSTGNVACFL